MKKAINFRKVLVILLLAAILGGGGYLFLLFNQAENKIEALERTIKAKEEHEEALWNCIQDCNKKKENGGECYCIQAEKTIKVY